MTKSKTLVECENSENSEKSANSTSTGLNSLIGSGGIADEQMEAGQLFPAGSVSIVLDAAAIDEKLRLQFDHWTVGVGEAHNRLYRFLGRIYEWAPVVLEQPGLANQIADLIKSRYGKKINWEKKTGEELLLMLAVGFGTTANANRSQWLKALRVAARVGAHRNECELAEWLSDVGGIMAAGRQFRSENGKTPSPTFDVADYLDHLPEANDPLTFALPSGALPITDGYQLLIVKAAATGGIEVRAHVTNPDVLEQAVKSYKADVDRVDKLLWDVNRYALRAAKNRNAGKMSASDVKAFGSAINKLQNHVGRQRFFTDDAEQLSVSDKPLASDRFPVLNPSYGIYDPGRYVKGAKETSLLPYVPDKAEWKKLTRLEQLTSPSEAYIDSHSAKKATAEQKADAQKLIGIEKARIAEEAKKAVERASVTQHEDA